MQTTDNVMASQDHEGEIFAALKGDIDPKVLEEREKAVRERVQAQYAKAQERLQELISSNSTLPVTISSIRVLGATNTRKSFLDRLFEPLLSANNDRPYTLQEALKLAGASADKLRRFDIYHDGISMFIDKPDSIDPTSTTSDIDIFLAVKEKGRIALKTGTDLGNTEGSAYGNLLLRNIFGGAESLNVNVSTGTRTRSSFTTTFDTPILSDPELRFSLDGFGSSTQKPWASHEEVLKGGSAKIRWAEGQNKHEVSYTGAWRQVTALAANASPSVRHDAGDSVKSSITHTWFRERRNHPFLPTSGYYMRTVSELAGWGPLQGDVAFWKSEVETSGALAVPLPGNPDSGVSLTAGLRAGLLCPLPLGTGSEPQASRINDRFQLGGPTDVRGFKIGGLGPRDGPDAVGGDVFAAGSVNLLFPFPRVGKDTPLRLQVFANGGRLLALQKTKGSTSSNVSSTVAKLVDSLPSLAAGVGVVYAHPAARFELNFSLPLVLRRGEEGRKGLQFGVGINFL